MVLAGEVYDDPHKAACDLQKEYAGFYKGKIAVVTYNKKTFKSELVRYLKLSDYATDK